MTTRREGVRGWRQINALVFCRFEGSIIGEELKLALHVHALIIEHAFAYVNSLFSGISRFHILAKNLPGYEDYQRRVKYRLMPGVW